jgi:hypothetical protein
MLNFFYLLSLLFLVNEFYYLSNRRNLDVKYKERNIEGTTVLDLIYYFTRFASWFWILLGLTTDLKLVFATILTVSIIKIPIFHISKIAYVWYLIISTFIRIALLSIIFISTIS